MTRTAFRRHVSNAMYRDTVRVVELIRRYSHPGCPPHVDQIDRPEDFLYALSGRDITINSPVSPRITP